MIAGKLRISAALMLVGLAGAVNAQVNTWVYRAHMITSRINFAAATGPDGRIYVFGGKNSTLLKASEAYDPSTDVWSPIADMPQADESGAVVTGSDGRIYIFYFTSFVYDTTTNSYDPISSPPFFTRAVGVGNDGDIYAVGVKNGSGATARYDPTTDTWTQLSVGTAYQDFSTGVAGPDGRIYVFGGEDSSNNFLKTARVYDPHADAWSALPDMLEPAAFATALVGGDGRFYVIGGDTNNGPSASEAYDPMTNSWSYIPETNVSRFNGAGATAHDGRIYVMGSGDTVESFQPTLLTVQASAISAQEAASFNGTVATLADHATGHTAANFTATIDWGDGSTSPGTIADGANPGTYSVSGQHTYAEGGSYTTSIEVVDTDGEDVTATGTATISDAPLTPISVNITGSANVPFSGKVGSFTDANPNGVVGDFTAIIHWGDGSTSPGIVSSNGSGGFDVSGSHTYSVASSYPLSVSIADTDGAGTVVNGSAAISVAPPVVSAASINAVEGNAFSGLVGSFTNPDPTQPASTFTASIDWGDGHTTSGTVSGSGGSFSVSGAHTFADEGSFVTGISVSHAGVATQSASGSATVSDAPLVATGVSIIAKNKNFAGVVATFTDGNSAALAGEFSATILWGDGASTTGVVKAASGVFQVSGSHTFAKKIINQVKVFIKDVGGSTATANSTIDTRNAK
jgi:N-acetylneuraminic acid mutarotase